MQTTSTVVYQMHHETHDLKGLQFGSWKVIDVAPVEISHRRKWLCRCKCGLEKAVYAYNLLSGKSLKCRLCSDREKVLHGHTKSGSKSREYKSWQSMKDRCDHPNRTGYKYYGGRGIGYCERWKSFDNFLDDMGPRPLGATLERIDNNGNYEPGNCRWATPKEQGSNMRNNRWVHCDGKRIVLNEASRITGRDWMTIFKSLNTVGLLITNGHCLGPDWLCA